MTPPTPLLVGFGGTESKWPMYNALVELHRRVLAGANLLDAAEATDGRCPEPEHAPGNGFLAPAMPIDCTSEEPDHVQVYVPGHYGTTTTSAIESERPVALPVRIDVDAQASGDFPVEPPGVSDQRGRGGGMGVDSGQSWTTKYSEKCCWRCHWWRSRGWGS